MTKFTYMSKIHLNQSYNFLKSGREKVGIGKLKNPKTFIDYSQTIDDIYENLEDCNPAIKRSVNSIW